MKKNKTMILGIVVLLVALAGAVVLVNQNQEMRKGAAFDTSTLQVLPSTKITASVGDTFAAQLWYSTSTNSKVDGVQTVVCYGTGITLASVVVNIEAGFNSDPLTVTNSTTGGACTTVVVTSMKAAGNLLTTGKVFTLYFKGISVGTGEISLSTSTSLMTGDNPASGTDKNITVTGVTGTSYEITTIPGSIRSDLFIWEKLDGKDIYAVGDVARIGLEYSVSPVGGVDVGRVSGINVHVAFNKDLMQATEVTVDDPLFDVVTKKEIDNSSGLVWINISSSMSFDKLHSGMAVVTIKFKMLKEGKGMINVSKSYPVEMVGYDNNGKSVQFSTVVGEDKYVVIGSTTSLLLKFKMTYLGTGVSAGCADPAKMPLMVIVRAADGTTKTFNNVIAIKLSDGVKVGEETLGVYQVALRLGDFNYGSNLAVFVKDGRHLQVKYGVKDQSDFYNKAGGELNGLTNDDASTPVFDFTRYPLLAGDVTGPDGTQDGVVDGLDFSYVKTQSIARTAADAGGYMLADLNGNCKMESQDLSELMLSLNERQGQLY